MHKFKGLDDTIIEFLTAQNKGTLTTYKSFFHLIIKYTGMNGKELLESKRADKNFEWERKIIQLKQWVKTQKSRNGTSYSDLAAKGVTTALRSFFEYYREPLKFNQTEKRILNSRSKRKTMDYRLENEDIVKLNADADLREKYILLGGKSFGLRISDFIKFTYGTFRSINLEQEPPIFLGELQTIKEGIPAYPFIDTDFLPIVKKVLLLNRDKPNSERILRVQKEEVTTILQKLADKVGLNLGGKVLRFHCLRKYLIDRLANNMSESKWKQIVGKSISEDAYVSPYKLRTGYSKTMQWTTIGQNATGLNVDKVNALLEHFDDFVLVAEKIKNKTLLDLNDPVLLKKLKDLGVIP